MRVIAGKARRLPLKTVSGTDTRPTTDRIKETLFNILQTEIPGCSFLDLFAGSGGIGIEALSRGAREAVFVEQDRAACECIRYNLEFTRLADQAKLLRSDVFSALARMDGRDAFDIIFMDPPYGKMLEDKALEFLSDSTLVDENTMIIVEASLKTEPLQIEKYGFFTEREKVYKTNKHIFIRKDRDKSV